MNDTSWKLKFCEECLRFYTYRVCLCIRDNELRTYFKGVIAASETLPTSLHSSSRIESLGNGTKHAILLPDCVTCVIHFHGNLCLCGQHYELLAWLGCYSCLKRQFGSMQSQYNCENLTSIPENTENPVAERLGVAGTLPPRGSRELL